MPRWRCWCCSTVPSIPLPFISVVSRCAAQLASTTVCCCRAYLHLNLPQQFRHARRSRRQARLRQRRLPSSTACNRPAASARALPLPLPLPLPPRAADPRAAAADKAARSGGGLREPILWQAVVEFHSSGALCPFSLFPFFPACVDTLVYEGCPRGCLVCENGLGGWAVFMSDSSSLNCDTAENAALGDLME
jgi:hypothetical protein